MENDSFKDMENQDIAEDQLDFSETEINNESQDFTNENDSPDQKLQKEISDLKDKYIRLAAEFDNYKKRSAKERLDLIGTASKDAMIALLPVLDDFDRAKKIAEDPSSTEHFSEGVTLVYEKLHKTLKNKGLQRMESNGEVFDSEFHEAITEIPAPADDLKGKIIDTVEPGYFLNDKIIRYAKVVVGK